MTCAYGDLQPTKGPRPAPRMLAIDLALVLTGLCYFDGEKISVGTWDTGKLRGHERENAIRGKLRTAVALTAPEVVLLEKLPPQITPGLIELAYLHGVIRNLLDELGPYVEVPVSHVKIYATGKGGGADSGKEQVLLAVERRYRHLVQVSNNNEADAFVLFALGQHAYGYPLPTVDDKKLPNTHLRVLDMLTGWPQLPGTPESPVGPDATTSRRPGRARTKRAST